MTRFDCTRVDELMVDFLYHELAGEEEEAVRLHLDGCARCGQTARELGLVREAARELPRLEPTSAVSARLLHQAAQARRPSVLAQLAAWLAPRRTYYVAVAAASLVVVLFVGYALNRQHFSARLVDDVRAPVAEAPAVPAAARPAAAGPIGAEQAEAPAAPVTAAGPAALPGEASRALSGAKNNAPEPPRDVANLDGRAKAAGGYPVRLDDQSLRRERDNVAGEAADVNSNVARAFDGAPYRKGGSPGLGLGGGGAQAAKEEARPETHAQGYAQPPSGKKRGVYDEAPAPVAAEPVAPPPPAAAAPAARPAAPAPNAAIQSQQVLGRPGTSYGQQAGPSRARGPFKSPAVGELEAGAGGAPRPAPAQLQQNADKPAPADREYKTAMDASCARQIILLNDFIRRYPNDDRVAAARARIAVCRAELTGDAQEIDSLVRSQKAPAPAARQQAETRSQAKAAPRKAPAAAKQVVAEKKAAKPAAKAKAKAAPADQVQTSK
jgi:hypothetical protein